MREPDFRRLWSAQFVSNIGSWMQTVAAQWVMLSLTTSALLVSAISAAASIPVLLLAVPAGALGDLADRKRLILATQLLMLLAAAALAVLSLASKLTPAILLALLFVIGCGTAASAPTWQTLQPELVPAANRSDAIALGSVNQNLARAIGPALGGLLLAATSAAALFAVNAVSFVAVLAAVAMHRCPETSSHPSGRACAGRRARRWAICRELAHAAGADRSRDGVHLSRRCDLGAAAAGGSSQAGPRVDRLWPPARLRRHRCAWRRDVRTGAAPADGPARALRVVRRCGRRDGDRACLLGQRCPRRRSRSWLRAPPGSAASGCSPRPTRRRCRRG